MRIDGAAGLKRLYYYDDLSVVAEKKNPIDDDWYWDKIYVVAPGVISHIIAESSWQGGSSWTNKFYHYDAIGNVVAHTASNSSLLSLFDQEAYGNVKSILGSGSSSGYHLTTKESDLTSSLYYFYQRWYDPLIGIFISSSPFSTYLEHPFSFCKNNPLKYKDPYGLLPHSVNWGLIPGIPDGKCLTAIQRARLEALDKQNQYNDKWMHCYVGCEAGRAGCPGWYVLFLSYLKELLDIVDLKTGLSDVEQADIDATMDGFNDYCVNCEKSCAEKYSPQSLR